MRIGIMSDTHGRPDGIDTAVEEAGEIDVWLHAGDYINDAEYLRSITDAQVINVAGNCDWHTKGVSDVEMIELCGKKIMLTHGHMYYVKFGTDDLETAALEEGADIVVYGHSHVTDIHKTGDLLVINPGSPNFPRGGSNKTFVVLELEQGMEPEVYLYEL